MFDLNSYYKISYENIDMGDVIAYYYKNNGGIVGFWFNESGEGFFMPLSEVAPQLKISKVEFIDAKTDIQKALIEIIKENNTVSYSISTVSRDDTTRTVFKNDYKPRMLLGEVESASKTIMDLIHD